MKLTLAEPRILKESISIISELVTETRIQVDENKLEIIAMDPANVAMVVFRMPSVIFAEYNVEGEEIISINLNQFKQILRRSKNKDVMTLEKDKNKLKIVLKEKSTRTFSIPLLDLEDRQQKIPELDFKAKITMASTTLNEAIDDVDVVSESVSFATQDKTFVVTASSDLSNAQVVIREDDDMAIHTSENHKSKYSTEYLKKMILASKLAQKVSINFSNDYPLKLEYLEKDKMSLSFILAPRVDND